MKNMKVLALDIDGVMTDGTKIYDKDSNVIAKRYNDKDFTAIKLFKELGVDVCFISSDSNVNSAMANEREVTFFHSRLPDGGIDKKQFVSVLEKEYDADSGSQGTDCEIYYVGDDFFDLDIMMMLSEQNRICPSDAPEYVKRMCGVVCETSGGEGVVAEILTNYLEETNRFEEVYDLVNHNNLV